jgi:uncharacterized membrane protein
MSSLLWLWACTSADDSGVDTAAAYCADAPAVTWASFGQGFVTEACDGCHASTAPDRYGAPEAVTFDTAEQCWAQADAIVAVATGEDPIMPPNGGVEEEDRIRLGWWLRCGVPCT